MSLTNPTQIKNKLLSGLQHYQKGQLQEAEACYQEVLQYAPNNADALHLLGLVIDRRGDFPKASELIKKSIELKPKDPNFYNNLGSVYQDRRMFADAIEYYYKAIDLKSDFAEAYYNLGNVYQKQGNFSQAIDCYQQAIKIAPKYSEAYNKSGLVYRLLKQSQEAINCYQKAIELQPNFAEAYNNCGNVYLEQQQFDEAQKHYQKALQLQPDYAEAYNNLGNVYKEQQLLIEAIVCFERAIFLRASYAEAHANLGLTLLYLGEFDRGFAEYEWRFNLEKLNRFKPNNPMWDGSDLEGKSIVLWNEQGLGDAIQFVRYAKLLQQKGAKVTLSVNSPLVRLFGECLDDKFSVLDRQSCDLSAYDFHISLNSLPYIFKTTLDTIPNLIPYIKAPTKNLMIKGEDTSPLRRIGIVWASKINTAIYQHKSCNIELFIDLLSLVNISLYSLQVGTDSGKIQPWVDNQRVFDLSSLLNDFADTASEIEKLDLIITVDTAVAHLAGAMGKPVWVLLPFVPDWRWQLEKSDTPWYPTMRLFRQQNRGDWTGVFQEVKEALQTSPPTPLLQGEGRLTTNNKQQRTQAESYYSEGYNYQQRGDFERSIRSYQQAIFLEPNHASAYNNLGNIYRQQRRLDESKYCLEKAISLKPDYALAYSNMGNVCYEKGQLTQAAKYYRKAIELKPDLAEAYNNLASVSYQQGHLQSAVQFYQQAIDLKPNYFDARTNLGVTLLSLGEFDRGFIEYEYRLKQIPPNGFQQQAQMWDGKSNIEGKSIVLWDEQGLGDTIQFVRYAYLVKDLGAKVILCVHSALVSLFKECLESDFVVFLRDSNDFGSYDYHVPLMSLPGIFHTNLDNIPNSIPYIKTPNPLHPILGASITPLRYRIGIVWASKINTKLYYKKSCKPELFIDLLSVENIALYSLQVGADADKIKPWIDNDRVFDLSSLLTDFVATASAIAQLDLVITIDTAVAHLAGAMGKPVWVLLPFVPDWRWLLERNDTPWYPTMRLFRQSSLDDWTGVFQQVKQELQENVGAQCLRPGSLGREGKRKKKKKREKDKQTTNNQQLIQQGIQHHERGELEKAEALYQQVLQQQPNNADALHLLGAIAYQRREYQKAERLVKQAIELNDTIPRFYNTLGNIYREQRQFDRSIELFQKAIDLHSNYAEAYNNIGIVYQERGQFDLAKRSYQQALQLQPKNAEIHYNIGLILLLLGDFDRGFAEYEWRFDDKRLSHCKPKTPMWDGREIRGKSIVLWNEQGLGDSIQFVRYAKNLKDLGAKVILSVHPSLVSLLEECLEGDFEVIEESNCDIYAWDYHASMMSLPGIFKTIPDTIPNSIPYIKAPLNSVLGATLTLTLSLWERGFAPLQMDFYRIGIVWASEPKNPMYHKKSCNLELFIDLLSLEKIALYSLQVGADAEKIQPWVDNDRIFDLSPLLTDFADTASIIAQLDLIITVDTAVAHLAGAMGKPVWVLLPFVPDWRWQLETSDTPWYPTMRLFRQPNLDDWTGVFQQVKQELQNLLKEESVGIRRGAVSAPSVNNQQLTLTSALSHREREIINYNYLGNSYQKQKMHPEAIECYQKVIELDPDNSKAYNNLGLVYYAQKQLSEALECYQKALQLNPDYVKAYNNLGIIYYEQGQFQQAKECYKKAIELEPNNVKAYNNLGNIYKELERFSEAVECYRKALSLEPNYPKAYSNMGVTYQEQRLFPEAMENLRKAIELEPNSAEAYYNLSVVYYELGCLSEAIKCCQKAIELQPNLGLAYCHRGLLFLSSGNFDRGLKDYEWRFEDKRLKRFQPKRPMWDGREIQGKSIVLWNEQGLGDSIQFIRYVRQLQEMKAKVIISAHPSLVKLFQECLEYSVEVVESSKCNIYGYDYHAAMMSLPYIFKTTPDTIPNSIPYIKKPLNSNCRLPTADFRLPFSRIGIVWASEKKNPMYRKKSCNPELFIDLLDVGNISLYSLQVGGDADKIQTWVDNDRVYDLSSLLTDFTDTASVIEQLDLIITIDTAVAHLAGAMGKPVWVLLPFVPDWRWQLEDRTTPWYPTMRLFRQPSLDDWTEVFQQVKQELEESVGSVGAQCLRPRSVEREGQTNNKEQTTNNQQLIQLSFDAYFKGQSKEAENYCKQVLQKEPNNADILHLLGVILHQKGNNKIAIELIKQALSLKPKEHTFYNNLGTVYQEEEMFAEALQCYDRALEILPNDVLLMNNIGNAYKKQGKFDEAKKCYDRAIELKPEFGSSHYNLGLLLLLLGDFERGLLEYEWRFEIEDLTRFKPKTSMWDGSNLEGKSIVLWNEQGLGDAIQFVRYAKLVKDLGAKVTICTHQCLISLFREGLEEEFEIIDRNACDVSNYDCHASLLSLPYILKTTPDTIPNSIPYIKAPIDSNCRLPIADCQLPSYRIGIVWASKNNTKIYRIKSFKPNLFIDLLDIGNIALYSLQVGKDVEEIKPWVDNDRIFDLSPLLNDFADTASVIEQLDLIITVDTAVAHLAGAMGKPVWVLLPFVADWRWQLDRSDTPWYLTMRLFRQPSLGDWTGVFKQVKQELQTSPPTPLLQGEGRKNVGIGRDEVSSPKVSSPLQSVENEKKQTKTKNKKKKGFSVTQTKNTAPSLPSTPKPITRHPLGIGWGMNLTTGWGNYGLNLVLQLLQMPDFAPVLLVASSISNDFNPLHRELLLPLLNQQNKLQKLIEEHQGKQIALNSPVLYALNKRFQGNLPIKGDRSVGVIFLEDTHILPDAIARAQQFDLVIAGSTWNGEILKSYGLENVRVCFQGIDPAKFHPGPKSNLCQNRFVVFSGGKLEYRKGQDIVVAAFKRFVSRHPDALLVTAWHNFWPEFMQGIDRVGHVQGLPNLDQNKRLLVKEWLVANGIPANACLDIGIIPNHLVGQVIREADVAVFTNRGEGGTNLVAMECLACGVPTILSANTGHLDLLGDKHCYALSTQRSVKSTSHFIGVEGWGESDVDEVVEVLEKVYNDRLSAKKKGEAAASFMQDWTWNKQIRRFCNILLENKIV
jgi:tetratricopeptide (TPR) repeat protein/glycosyltransferase involved in cell wall biosynthesis